MHSHEYVCSCCFHSVTTIEPFPYQAGPRGSRQDIDFNCPSPVRIDGCRALLYCPTCDVTRKKTVVRYSPPVDSVQGMWATQTASPASSNCSTCNGEMLWLLPKGTVRCPRCHEGYFEKDDPSIYTMDKPGRPLAHTRTALRFVQNGSTVVIPKPTVLIDAAEHMGYTFARFPKLFDGTSRKRLKLGDYSLVGYEDVLAIERKTLADLVHSIIANRQDFIAKCDRLSHLKRKCLVVEATLSQVKSRYSYSSAHPNAVFGSLVAAQERWGIPVHFLDNARLSEEFVASMLSKWHAYEWLEANGKSRCLIDGDI